MKVCTIFFVFMSLGSGVLQANSLDMNIASTATQAVPLAIFYVENDALKDAKLSAIANHVQRCFAFTEQFSVAVTPVQSFPTKKEVKALHSEKKVLLLLVLSSIKGGYEWRLYDTFNGKIVGGQRLKKEEKIDRVWAYALADQIWPLLTNQEGFFLTKLAYCKKKTDKKVKHIYIADFDGSHEQCIVATPTINIAPRWNHDRLNPLLFYSDYTPTNVRLQMVGLDAKSRVASDFDGLNMIPAFCDDGSKVAYCASRGDGGCQIYYYDKKNFKNITHNYGNNVSPSLSADGTLIFFCSDFETKMPQLYLYNVENDQLERLTGGGYVGSPRYNSKVHKVAYAKQVDGFMQLFLYDVAAKVHEQLTFDTSNKQECAWSPCGNWLIYGVSEVNKPSRIAMLNRHSKKQRYLTKLIEDCSYPDWSPRYQQFPIVS